METGASGRIGARRLRVWMDNKCLDDFKEKYPNAQLQQNGYPYVNPCHLGCLRGVCAEYDYKSCWNEPIE